MELGNCTRCDTPMSSGFQRETTPVNKAECRHCGQWHDLLIMMRGGLMGEPAQALRNEMRKTTELTPE